MNNKVVRINFFGGPGVSKSTTAAKLFADLKVRWSGSQNNPQVELISEYIKDWAWLKRIPQSWDQYYIFASQIHKEDIVLRHNNTSVITDSPIWLQLAYMKRGQASFYEACRKAAVQFDRENGSLNIMLKRSVPYQELGRYENYQQALEMDELIKTTLQENNISYIEYDPMNDYDLLFCYVVNYFEV